MSETDDASPQPKPRNWLAGRSDRREYWVLVALIVAINVALSFVIEDGASVGSTAAFMFVQIRRFHDLGRSGWWALALLVGQFAVMLPLMFLGGDSGVLASLLIALGVMIAMGAIPGQPHENRFGPPRGKRSLKEVFS